MDTARSSSTRAPMATERRLLRSVEQRLLSDYQASFPAGRIIRMVLGTAHLLHKAGARGEQLADQVEAGCRAALEADLEIMTG